jgi:o-succinylbenzoate synthase
MKLKAYRYTLQLEPPLRVGQRTLTDREGVLLSPVDQPHCWGEAAPLPGLSQETVDDVIRGLQVDTELQPPSLLFALESLEAPSAGGRVPVSALLWGTRAAVLKRARELHDLPFPTVKLKVGRQRSVAEEIRLVADVRQQLRDDQPLRLDANRRWALPQAVQFGKGVRSLGIEYVEEPLRRPRECEAFFEQTGVPYALDETLAESPRMESFPHVAALVVKPTLLGDQGSLQHIQSSGVPLVFSSCFESGLGVLSVARLAAAYAPSTPAGLDTSRWILRDLLVPPLNLDQGFVDLDASNRVDYSLLEEVF